MEARRRFPEVKEAAERALQRLRTAQESLRQDAPLAEQAAAVATSEEVLLPFTLALACKSEALPLCALSAVQRMISHSAVAPVHLPAIASQLIARAQMPSEDSMLLKVLQTVLTIASSPALLLTDLLVSQLLLLCLTLLGSRSVTVRCGELAQTLRRHFAEKETAASADSARAARGQLAGSSRAARETLQCVPMSPIRAPAFRTSPAPSPPRIQSERRMT